MKFGMNMLLWGTDVTGERYLPLFENLKAMGFDGVELPVFELRPDRFADLGRRLDDIGLERTAVTVRAAGDNPISPDANVRRAGVDRTKAALDCCQAGGMGLLVGPYYAALGEFSGAGPTAQEWAWAVEAVRAVSEYADACGTDLALEFLNRFEIYLLNSAADTARFVEEVDHPRCRMMFDTFHAHIEEKDVAEAISGCADVLAHVHISENDRSTPGSGQVHWDRVFTALKTIGYDGWLTIEAFGFGLPDLAAATRIWRPMFETQERLAEEGLAFMRQQWETGSPTPASPDAVVSRT